MLEIATWALLLSASIPILMCWATFSDEGSRFSIALLGLVTASYGWLLLASVVPFVAGPNYSGERVIVCNANIGLCLAAGIALAVTQKPRALFGLAGGWVAFGWVYFVLGCDHLLFFDFISNRASEGLESLQGISLEILNARFENNRIVVTTVAGVLNLDYADESIEIDGGRKLDLFELNAAAKRASGELW